MIQKTPVCERRVRRIPRQFSWVDHRLVSDHYLDRCSHRAAALSLFLVTVSDAVGLSYYSETSLASRLALDVAQAREELVRLDLIAYREPIYQVLSLEPEVGHD